MPSLGDLLKTNGDLRDDVWEKAFLSALPTAKVSMLTTEAQQGPDGWPYFLVSTEATDATEPLVKVLEWLSSRGIGLVINPQRDAPDYVLTYGMIWNFRERGEFLSPTRSVSAGAIEIQPGAEVLTGAPTEQFLPSYARAILKQFLLDQGIFAPKILLVSFDKSNYDLCFSLESLKSPPEKEHAGIAEALAWFLPAHYAVSLVSEKSIPGFLPL